MATAIEQQLLRIASSSSQTTKLDRVLQLTADTDCVWL